VGPIYSRRSTDAADLLRGCYFTGLELAKQNGLRSIAFPSLSTGVYGYDAHCLQAEIGILLRRLRLSLLGLFGNGSKVLLMLRWRDRLR